MQGSRESKLNATLTTIDVPSHSPFRDATTGAFFNNKSTLGGTSQNNGASMSFAIYKETDPRHTVLGSYLKKVGSIPGL
jgi:hypothetical protein